MTDEPQKENKLSIPQGWSISPSTLDMLQEAAEAYKRQNEMFQKALQGPLEDWSRIAKFQKEQEETLKAALQAVHIPKLNLEWINEAAQVFQKATAKPTYIERPVMTVYHRQTETPSRSVEEAKERQETNELLRQLIEERRISNALQKAALEKRTATKKKVGSQVLVLNEDGKLFVQNRPKSFQDLSRSPQKRKILIALSNRFISTENLWAASGCKSKSAFYKAIEDLRSDTKNTLKVKVRVIENDPDQGYRFVAGYKLVNEWRD